MSTMVPLYGFGGGGSGGTLTVTAPAGATVTVSKDDKSKTRVADSDGVAVFRGLSSGEWTITITDGEQTAQKTVTINADFETVIAFFSATINVTYPEGSTCTATDGVATLTAPDTSGTWTCIVPNDGTWTITSTNGTDSDSESVSITADGQSESITLSYLVILFDNAAFYDELTGGWTKSNSSCSVSGGKLHIYGEGYIISKKKVDISPYSSIKVKISNFDSSNVIDCGFDIRNSANDGDWVAYKSVTKNGTYSLDVSSFNGSYYLDFYCDKYTDMDVTYCELVR